MKKVVWANTLVKNEERYLWYAVSSIIDHVDKMLLWDTGSTDNTVQVIKELIKKYGSKIEFKEVGSVDPERFTQIRQEMLDKTKSDWLVILDGDEVWWQDSIKKLINLIQKEGDKLETIISPYYNIIGDIYHYQEKSAGKYQIDNYNGHINIRALNRRIPGLHLEKPHGQQGFYDGEGVLIQKRPEENRKYLDAPYFHFTNMVRSSTRQNDLNVPKRSLKFKHEIGISFPKDFSYPEVFYQKHPNIVFDVWGKMSNKYLLRASVETILRKVKRKFLPSKNAGY